MEHQANMTALTVQEINEFKNSSGKSTHQPGDASLNRDYEMRRNILRAFDMAQGQKLYPTAGDFGRFPVMPERSEL